MKTKILAFVAVLLVVGTVAPVAYAVTDTADSTLSQTITAGTISTDIRDGSNAIVASPSFAMTSTVISTSQQTISGTFGTSTQRISVDNPGGANNGWTLALCATTPGTEVWTDGTHTYKYNDTAATGQLTVDPSAANLTAVSGTTTAITKGSSTTFSGTSPITLLTAGSGSDDIWNGYITGVGLSQTIPANQPAGTYTINMTQTVTSS